MSNSIYDDVPLDDAMRWKALIILVMEDSAGINEQQRSALQNAIEELLPELVDLQIEYYYPLMYIRTLTYNISAKWHEQDAVKVDEYAFPQMSCFGLSNFGEACYKLNDYLNPEKIVSYKNPIPYQFSPNVIFCIRSNPTGEYMYGLNKLSRNGFFRGCCNKIVYFMGKGNLDTRKYDALFADDKNAREIREFSPEQIRRNLFFHELREDWFNLDYD